MRALVVGAGPAGCAAATALRSMLDGGPELRRVGVVPIAGNSLYLWMLRAPAPAVPAEPYCDGHPARSEDP
jgi:hypothetical protein